MTIARPTDPYDAEAWALYHAAHPGLMRSVGAEGAEGEGEGEGSPEGSEGDGEGEQAEAAEEAAAVEAAKVAEGAAGEKPEESDWRSGIQDEKLREHAGRFNSVDELVKANLDSRQKLSKAIIPPGKDASDEDIAAYRKAVGIPETPEGYEFAGDLPEDEDAKAEMTQSREVWAERFHNLGVSSEVGKELARMVHEDRVAYEASINDADKKYADEQKAKLDAEWGPDAEKNRVFADRAAQELFGDDIEEVRHIETRDGRYVLDDARFQKVLARIGREMGEGSLGPVLSESDRESISEQIADLREKSAAAARKGDNAAANKYYQQEQDLIAKSGNAPIVGSSSRAA